AGSTAVGARLGVGIEVGGGVRVAAEGDGPALTRCAGPPPGFGKLAVCDPIGGYTTAPDPVSPLLRPSVLALCIAASRAFITRLQVGYRRPGSFSRHFMTTCSTARLIPGLR